jgi:hypothetical protein
MLFGGVGFVGSILGLVVLLAVAAIFGGAPATAAGGALGIPPVVFSAYLTAEAEAPTIAPDCEVDWPVIAGIWKVESHHATTAGRRVDPAGQVTPPLYGVTLDGSTPGTRVVPDTWTGYSRDGNGDGTRDPQNVHDAALAYLCLRTPGDYTQPEDLTRALYGYDLEAPFDGTSQHDVGVECVRWTMAAISSAAMIMSARRWASDRVTA